MFLQIKDYASIVKAYGTSKNEFALISIKALSYYFPYLFHLRVMPSKIFANFLH